MTQRTIDLVHEGKVFSVLKRRLFANCEIFKNDSTPIQSRVAVQRGELPAFVEVINGDIPTITSENVAELCSFARSLATKSFPRQCPSSWGNIRPMAIDMSRGKLPEGLKWGVDDRDCAAEGGKQGAAGRIPTDG
jgi:hypothetical protein